MLINASTDALKHALDVAQARHGLLARNLANLNTAGYERQDIDFEAALKDTGASIQSLTQSKGAPDLVTDAGDLAANDAFYGATARLLSLKYQALHQALK